MTEGDLVYAAALVDTMAALKVRRTAGQDLPALILQGSKHRGRAVSWLCEATGSKVTAIHRDYNRPNCVHHCPQPHVHVESDSGVRWSVTGMKATIVLAAVMPFLRFQREDAEKLIKLGLQVGYSTSVVNDMARRGWPIPELKHQRRARVALAVVGDE